MLRQKCKRILGICMLQMPKTLRGDVHTMISMRGGGVYGCYEETRCITKEARKEAGTLQDQQTKKV
ncbi:hypothetical protein C0638_14965 [Paenibacillus sp. lzh-N1]|nr:hypothetical protein C0638_14965 [Paenibacillus sp. lzh-N1]